MAEKHGKMEPKRGDQNKQGEVPLDVHEDEKIENTMKPERRTLESSRAGTGTEAPGEPRLLNRDMQPINIGGLLAHRCPRLGGRDTFSSSRGRDETRNNFTSHRLSGNRVIADGMETRRGSEVKQ